MSAGTNPPGAIWDELRGTGRDRLVRRHPNGDLLGDSDVLDQEARRVAAGERFCRDEAVSVEDDPPVAGGPDTAALPQQARAQLVVERAPEAGALVQPVPFLPGRPD